MQTAQKPNNLKTASFTQGLLRKYVLGCLVLMAILALSGKSQAQGIERYSLSGETAAAALRGSDSSQPYNLKLGPVGIRADSYINTSFNDNINIAKYGRQADAIIQPGLGVHALWQLTDLNTLTFDVSMGYQYYVEHSGNSSFTVAPNSQLNFNIFVGDFKFNIYDRFSYLQDPIGVSQLSNTSQFARLKNDAGVNVDWDLNDIVLSVDYDHTNYWVFESQFDYLDYQADTVSPKIAFTLSKTVEVGLCTAFSDMRYDQNIQNNNTSFSAGPYVTALLTKDLAFNAFGGYYHTEFDSGGLINDNENIDSFYCGMGLNHRINDVMTETLTAGKEYIPGLTSNFTQRIYANYSPAWQATTNINLALNFWWENLDDSNSSFSQNANRYGAGFNIGYKVTDHATLSLGYQYVLKDANPSALSYYQNLATIGFLYQF